METVQPCRFLEWDTEFFGLRIACVVGHRLNRERARAILKWCADHAIECLYFLADLDDPETIGLAQEYGFHLVDVRVTLQCEVGDLDHRCGEPSGVQVRPARPDDRPILQAIARSIDYASRFYFDPGFSKEACAALYATWIRRSCEGAADVVLVAETDGRPVGYVAGHLCDESHGHIGLVGVADEVRNRGVGRALICGALRWFQGQGVRTVSITTQGRNVAAQRLYQRCGFLTQSVQIWYHKWMHRASKE